MNLNSDQAHYVFGEEKLKLTLAEIKAKILACRSEIKKHQRPETLWKIYKKELMNLHALRKYRVANPI